jgi:ribose/xylose/arabinose/galactoside ABC-type transport system permease subunit
VKLRVNPFLTTLAMLLTLRGAVIYLIPEGVYGLPTTFTFLGSYKIAGIFPVAIIILFLVYIVGFIITDHTSFGKNLFAIGNNQQAAFVAGINVSRVRIMTFMLAGLFAALGGVIEVGRLKSIAADPGQSSIMLVFAATILAYRPSGGEGKVSGIFGGVGFGAHREPV